METIKEIADNMEVDNIWKSVAKELDKRPLVHGNILVQEDGVLVSFRHSTDQGTVGPTRRAESCNDTPWDQNGNGFTFTEAKAKPFPYIAVQGILITDDPEQIRYKYENEEELWQKLTFEEFRSDLLPYLAQRVVSSLVSYLRIKCSTEFAVRDLLTTFAHHPFVYDIELDYIGESIESFLSVQSKINYNVKTVKLYGNWPQSTADTIVQLMLQFGGTGVDVRETPIRFDQRFFDELEDQWTDESELPLQLKGKHDGRLLDMENNTSEIENEDTGSLYKFIMEFERDNEFCLYGFVWTLEQRLAH
ncbi:hypothetical protein L596_019212 [Steinernema carpocapsae]|uniref:Uncharacterized protein n=1 Tax=Steinernema carpocapsae TaxID=34508 RepID=A0A4U5MPN8_STECR|nr:hypothetical protein L596_019212 [Steinernema carpocapsae]